MIKLSTAKPTSQFPQALKSHSIEPFTVVDRLLSDQNLHRDELGCQRNLYFSCQSRYQKNLQILVTSTLVSRLSFLGQVL